MSAPEKVRLKRKRTEDPPEALLLTRAQDVASSTPSKRIRYVIEKTTQPARKRSQSPIKSVVSRLFHLKRVASTGSSPNGGVSKGVKEAVPTIEETSRPSHRPQAVDTAPLDTTAAPHEANRSLKRPGKGSATGAQSAPKADPMTNVASSDMSSLADSMHEFALQELAKPVRASITSRPKMSAAQVRDRHERMLATGRAVSQSSSFAPASAMDVDGDFVYDTYILTSGEDGDIEMDGNVGLIVIDEHDEDYWHELLAQTEVEEQEDSDDDENAEDHYAADYPEDELASDDEFGREAYRFRARAGSDDEQWDHREDSDNESEVYDGEAGFGNKASMIRRWENDLGMRGATHYDYD